MKKFIFFMENQFSVDSFSSAVAKSVSVWIPLFSQLNIFLTLLYMVFDPDFYWNSLP